MSEEKKYAPQIGLWRSKNGKESYSVFIDAKTKEILDNAQEGGRLVLTEVPETVQNDNPRAPQYRITFFSADEAQQPKGKGRSAPKAESGSL